MRLTAYLAILVLTCNIFSQNLSKQRIWKVVGEKRSIYFDQGIFHSDLNANESVLKNIRNSYVKDRGFERLVFDFQGGNPPKIYGHISIDKKKLYLDFFKTTLDKNFKSIENVKYVDSIDFFNVDKDLLSLEINTSDKVSYDVFYLMNPARIVVDIKK